MKQFSLTKHMNEDLLRISIENTYRAKPEVIDLGSAGVDHLIRQDIVKSIISDNSADLARLVNRYPIRVPDAHLEDSLSKRFKKETGRLFKYNQFVLFRGTLGGGAFCTLSLFRNKVNVLVPESCYQYHKTAFASYGKRVVEIKAGHSGLMDLDELTSVMHKLRGQIAFVYFNSTYGEIPTKEYFEKLARLTEKAEVLLVYDADVIFTLYNSNEKHNLPSVEVDTFKNLLILGNLTKEFGCPGLRISYGLTNQRLASEIRAFQEKSMEMIPTLNSLLAKMIVDKISLNKIRIMLKGRMKTLVEDLRKQGWTVSAPDTGINLFIEVPPSFAKSKTARGCDLFHFYLLSELGILTRPGCTHSINDFNRIRLVITEPKNKIIQALRRLEENGVTYEMQMPEGLELRYRKLYFEQRRLELKLGSTAKETDRLLEIYDSYRSLEAEYLKIKESKTPQTAWEGEKMARQLSKLSDSIRFENPLVWMMFKDKRGLMAQQEEERIASFGDFKEHSRHEGSACKWRMSFFNDRLKQRGINLLDRKSFPNSLHLHEIYSRKEIVELATNPEIVREWKKYEFYEIAGKPAKWKNYL